MSVNSRDDAPAPIVSVACDACGEKVASGDAFCPGCGAEVSAAMSERLEDKAKKAKSRDASNRRMQKRGDARKRKKVKGAAKWILALSIIFAVSGTIMGFIAKNEADEFRTLVAQNADDEIWEIPLENGEVRSLTVGELKKEVDEEVTLVFVTNYILAFMMLSLYFWARKSPVPAMLTAMGLYIVVIVVNAVIDPATIVQGILIKILFLGAMVAGIKAAFEQRAATEQRAHQT